MPTVVIARDLAEGRLVELLANYRFQGASDAMFLLYPATKFVPLKVQLFRDFLINAV